MKIIIPKGHRGFKKDLPLDFSNKKLTVITGLNGSGKTTVLSYLYRSEKEKNPSSVFFKTTNLGLYNELRKSSGFSRYRSSRERFLEQENLTVEEIWDEIYRLFSRFCLRKKIYHNGPQDALNMLFNKDSELYEYGFSFLYEISSLISESTGESKLSIDKALGIPAEEKIKRLVKSEIKKVSGLNQNSNDFKALCLKYDNGLNLSPRGEEYTPRYRGSYADASDIVNLQEIDSKIRKKLERDSRIKAKIKNQLAFDEYIYGLINPFQSMEAIIDKLSRKIEDEKNKKQRRKKAYWEQINDEIQKLNNEFSEKKFTYLLNPPSRKKYEITFHSQKKKPYSEHISFQDLSSGEKMIFELICYYFVSCKDENSKDTVNLIILDEFDANLNPVLAELYLKTVNKEFVENGIKVILTTHSPSTVAEVEPQNLCELVNEEDGHRIEWANNEDGKKKILEKLAPKFVYDEELGPIGAIKGSKDVIIFVEGKTDDEYFPKKAEALGLKNYKFIPCDGADNIPTIIKALCVIPYFKKIIKTKTIIGLFDLDEKGITAIHKMNGDKECVKKKTQDYRNNKKPIIHKYLDSYLLALIPNSKGISWQDHLNHPYRLEELKNDENTNGGAVDRLFEEIKTIVDNNKKSKTNKESVLG